MKWSRVRVPTGRELRAYDPHLQAGRPHLRGHPGDGRPPRGRDGSRGPALSPDHADSQGKVTTSGLARVGLIASSGKEAAEKGTPP